MTFRKSYNCCFSAAGTILVLIWLIGSCGHPQGPELSSDKESRNVSISEPLTGKALSAARPSGEGISELTDPVRFKVFSKPLEPLTIQRGGSVKITLPLTEEVLSPGILRSAEFRISVEGVTGSVIQGKTLSVNVGEDAPEGRYVGRLIFRLVNGREAIHNLQLSVIP